MLRNKVVFCGNSQVGKTNLFNILIGKLIKNEYHPTQIASYGSYVIDFDNNSHEINLWDISGDLNISIYLKSYLKNVDVILFVIDCTNLSDLDEFSKWKDLSINNDSLIEPYYVLIINKIYLDIGSKNYKSLIQEFVFKNQNIEFFEVSCINNIGIFELKKRIAEMCVQKSEERLQKVRNSQLNVSITPPIQNKSYCC